MYTFARECALLNTMCVGGNIYINKVVIEVDNILKGLRRRFIFSSCGGQFFKPV